MKNNRQIGLDGKIFISTAMHRGKFFVLMLMLYGIVTAAADILKLTGASGVAMGSFTTTLLIYDFIVSLLLVVVVFYAYFLECGADVPLLREKPLVIFGFTRLGYYLLLSYYLCYRMLYCSVNRDTISPAIGVFYGVYLVLVLLLILANCYIFNIITRNLIRRSYEKDFRFIAAAGFIVQVFMPVSYIIARSFMDDIGDEYFTTAVCDLLRLLVAPMLLTSVWFLFLHGVGQVHDVFSEVDSALKEKRYQITYTSGSSKKPRRKEQSVPPVTATMLPAGSDAAKALPQVNLDTKETVSDSSTTTSADNALAAAITSKLAENIISSDSTSANALSENLPSVQQEINDDEIVTTFAAEARRAVAQSSALQQQMQHSGSAIPQSDSSSTQSINRNQSVNALPVQEFDPYPSASVPHRSQQVSAQQPKQTVVRRTTQHNSSGNPANQQRRVQNTQYRQGGQYAQRQAQNASHNGNQRNTQGAQSGRQGNAAHNQQQNTQSRNNSGSR